MDDFIHEAIEAHEELLGAHDALAGRDGIGRLDDVLDLAHNTLPA